MDWPDALELVIARTRHERFRELCDEAHPDHEAYRRTVLAIAGCPAKELPPVATQVRNVVSAITRVALAAISGQPVVASEALAAERISLCHQCEHRTAEGKCAKCGCYIEFKARIMTESCPIGIWTKG